MTTKEITSDAKRDRETVRIAKQIIASRRPVSPRTAASYRRDYERLHADAALSRCKATFFKLRAAFVWGTVESIRDVLDDYQDPRNKDQQDLLIRILRIYVYEHQNAKYVERIDHDMVFFEDGAADSIKKPGRCSKKVGLKDLPDGWREQLIDAASAKWVAPLSVLAVTGCRPSELALGVMVTNWSPERVELIVRGTKVTQQTGQEFRSVTVDRSHPIAARLPLNVDAGWPHSIEIRSNDAAIRAAISKLGKELFPDAKYRVSPYSFRHQFSADLKRGGFTKTQVASALGQQSDRTSEHYGRSRQGATNPLRPLHIAAETGVREHPARNPSERCGVNRRILDVAKESGDRS